MSDMIDTLRKLHEPFDPDVIHWRIGATTQDKKKGMALAYVDARDVMERLDHTIGPANWQVRHPWNDGNKIACEIGIRIDGEWVWKGDGAGATDVEADKGSFSDSFKRAGVMWGIARYLYDLDSPWVELDGKKIKASEFDKLKRLVGGKTNRKVKDDDWAPGPCANRGEIAAMAQAVIEDLEACSDLDTYHGIERARAAFFKQMQANSPGWWDREGEPPGMKQRLDRLHSYLSSREAGRLGNVA